MPGAGHERQRRFEHVEVPPQVHGEHREPVLLGAFCEAGVARDARHVDDGVEPAVLVDQLLEQAPQRVAVGHRRRRGPGRATCRHDATGGGLLLLWEALRTVEGHERIDGDDEPAAAAELLGDRSADPTSSAGHDGYLPTCAHDAVDRTSSSRPSNVAASSHCSSTSR